MINHVPTRATNTYIYVYVHNMFRPKITTYKYPVITNTVYTKILELFHQLTCPGATSIYEYITSKVYKMFGLLHHMYL